MAAEAGRKNSILTVLKSIVQEVNQIPRLTDALFRLAERVKQTMGVDSCSIYLADYNSQAFVLKATDGLAPRRAGSVPSSMSGTKLLLAGRRFGGLWDPHGRLRTAPNEHLPAAKGAARARLQWTVL